MCNSEIEYCNKIRKSLGGDKKCYSIGATTAGENRKRIEIRTNNRHNYCRIRVDDCLIKKNTKKCDYVFVKCDTKQFLFVELKGKGEDKLKHAVEQILSTIKYFNERLDIAPDNICGCVISNGLPAKANEKFKKFKKQFKRRYRYKRLVKRTNQAIINENQFC